MDGNDFVPVVLALSQMIQNLDDVKEVIARVGTLQSAFRGAQPETSVGGAKPDTIFGDVTGLLAELEKRTGRQIQLRSMQADVGQLPEKVAGVIRESVIQLVRNAAVHGAEAEEARSARGKSPKTAIDLEAFKTDFGLRVVVRDDGHGLDYQRLAERALEMEAASPGLIETLVDTDQNTWRLNKLADLIFLPGFTLRDTADRDAGRGTGLDLVKTSVEGCGGTVQVMAETGHFTAFILDLPLTVS